MKILVAPHDDDQVLFSAYTVVREKPLVVICTDSFVQPARGEAGCSAEERAKETEEACSILGVPVMRLKLRDDSLSQEDVVKKLELVRDVNDVQLAYAPAPQFGNPHHDMVALAAQQVFPNLVQYTTYSKHELWTVGTHEVRPTEAELDLKKRALQCYKSQLRINKPHFDAVAGRSEWLVQHDGLQRLHLGCGRKLFAGWINLDAFGVQGMPGEPELIADVTKGIPVENNFFHMVYSEDFLEHLPPETKVFVINEIWRVLKPGGFMEHYVPNAGSRNDFGSPSHLSHWNLQCFEHFDKDSYRWEKDRGYEGFIGAFTKVEARLINFQVEEDGVKRAQSLYVKYRAVK